MQLIREKGIDVNLQDESGCTLLHYAAMEGKAGMAKSLLSVGGSPNIQGYHGWTPLHMVKGESGLKVAQELLAHPATAIDLKDKDGLTPAHRISYWGELKVLKYLIKKGGYQLEDKNTIGHTVLHIASQEGHLSIVEFLCQNGAKVNSHDCNGWTPLHMAVFSGKDKVVEFFLSKNLDPNLQSLGTVTEIRGVPDMSSRLLHAAAKRGHTAVVRVLLKYGANPSLLGGGQPSLSPLHLACEGGYTQVILELIKGGADLNQKEPFWNQSPIYFAQDVKTLNLLLANGADPNLRSEESQTLLCELSEEGNVEMVKALLEDERTDPNFFGKGESPLHVACRESHSDIVHLLCKRGAEIDLKNEWEETPLEIAQAQGNKKVLKKLLRQHRQPLFFLKRWFRRGQ